MEIPTASTTTCGSYLTGAGPREVVIVRYDESSYAVFDQRQADGVDRDERCVEPELLTAAEAEALARDYLDNARPQLAPLVRAA